MLWWTLQEETRGLVTCYWKQMLNETQHATQKSCPCIQQEVLNPLIMLYLIISLWWCLWAYWGKTMYRSESTIIKTRLSEENFFLSFFFKQVTDVCFNCSFWADSLWREEKQLRALSLSESSLHFYWPRNGRRKSKKDCQRTPKHFSIKYQHYFSIKRKH